jgi:hypothetical protein
MYPLKQKSLYKRGFLNSMSRWQDSNLQLNINIDNKESSFSHLSIPPFKKPSGKKAFLLFILTCDPLLPKQDATS